MVTPVVEKLWARLQSPLLRCAHFFIQIVPDQVPASVKVLTTRVLCLCNELLAQITFLPPTRNVVVYTLLPRNALSKRDLLPLHRSICGSWKLGPVVRVRGVGKSLSPGVWSSAPSAGFSPPCPTAPRACGARRPAAAAAAAARRRHSPSVLIPPPLPVITTIESGGRPAPACTPAPTTPHVRATVNRLAPPRALQSRRQGGRAILTSLALRRGDLSRQGGARPPWCAGRTLPAAPLSLTHTGGASLSLPPFARLLLTQHLFFGLCGGNREAPYLILLSDADIHAYCPIGDPAKSD